VLRDIRRRYHDTCVLKPRLDLEAHNDAKRQRSTDAATKAEESAKAKALAFMGFKDVEIVTTDAGLATIRAGFESRGKLLGTKGSFVEYLRSQLRAREHTYGQTRATDALPAIGSGSTLEEVTRIVDGLRPLFAKPLLFLRRCIRPAAFTGVTPGRGANRACEEAAGGVWQAHAQGLGAARGVHGQGGL